MWSGCGVGVEWVWCRCGVGVVWCRCGVGAPNLCYCSCYHTHVAVLVPLNTYHTSLPSIILGCTCSSDVHDMYLKIEVNAQIIWVQTQVIWVHTQVIWAYTKVIWVYTKVIWVQTPVIWVVSVLSFKCTPWPPCNQATHNDMYM